MSFLAKIIIVLNFTGAIGSRAYTAASQDYRDRVLAEADRILNLANVTYHYGGRNLGTIKECDRCTRCLELKAPSKTSRLTTCDACRLCSLDCSNFVSLVFERAGMRAPYLTTLQMRNTDDQRLRARYRWLNLGPRSQRALRGDLLVYPGHVVIVERVQRPGYGDVVHATSGRELKGPGLGIQRHRNIAFDTYKGRLQKVLRHVDIMRQLTSRVSPRKRHD